MGYVELHDGTMNRRIRVPGLSGSLKIDVSVPDEAAVTVPEQADIRLEQA